MPNPPTAATWAKECSQKNHAAYSPLCYHWHYDQLCVDCADAYARQQVVVALEKLANHTAKGFTGCVVCKYVSEAGHREDCLLAAMIRALET